MGAPAARGLSPSGRQVSLRHGDQEVVVVEVGGGIRSYTCAGLDVLDGYLESEACPGARGQILAPWPNRLRDGRYEWDGQVLQVPLSEPERHNAIHGLVRWSTWDFVEVAEASARLRYRLYPQPGWAWILDLEVSYSLVDPGLEVRTCAVNRSDQPFPFGLGWHPYLAVPGVPGGRIDGAVLRLPASLAYRSDSRGLPAGTFAVEGTGLDFRGGRPISDAVLDTCFTGLERDASGRVTVALGCGGRATNLWMDSAFTHVMVYTGDTLGDASRRRRGLAVEPMTCPPDMLRSGEGRVVIGPGERFEAVLGIVPLTAVGGKPM